MFEVTYVEALKIEKPCLENSAENVAVFECVYVYDTNVHSFQFHICLKKEDKLLSCTYLSMWVRKACQFVGKKSKKYTLVVISNSKLERNTPLCIFPGGALKENKYYKIHDGNKIKRVRGCDFNRKL